MLRIPQQYRESQLCGRGHDRATGVAHIDTSRHTARVSAPERGGSGLARGLAVLLALGSEQALQEGGLGVMRVAAMVGAHKSQVSRTLATLAKEGFVDRSADRSYRLGWRFHALAAEAGDRGLLLAAAPVLERLVATVGETAYLSVRRGTEVLTVLSRSPGHAVQAVGWVGRTVPAPCSASGRVLLFGLAPDELVQLFGDGALEQPTPAAPRDAAELARRVQAAARRGVAFVDEEFEVGLVAIAAPVCDARGAVVAALNVSGPKFRLGPRRRAAEDAVRAAAAELSAPMVSTSTGRMRSASAAVSGEGSG